MKITSDKILTLIIYLGFTSVSSVTSLQELQTDAIAHRGVRLASIGLAFFLSFSICCLRSPLHYLTGKTIFPLFLYFCAAAITTFWSLVPSLTMFKCIELSLVILLGLIGISLKNTKSYELFDLIIIVFSIQLVIVWVEAFLFPNLAFRIVRGTTPLLGSMLQGVYPILNPNTIGFIGGIIAVSYFPRVLSNSKIFRSENILFLLGMSAVIASYSRGALLASGVVILMFCVINRNYKLILFFILISLGLFLLDKNIIINHLQRGKEYKDLATFSSGRTNIWDLVVEHFSVFTFGQGYAVGFRSNHFLGNTNAHNNIFEILTGSGVLGVLAWLLMYFNIFSRFLFCYTQQYKIDNHFFSILNSTIYLFLSSFTNVRGVYLDYGMLLFVAIVVYLEKTPRLTSNTKSLKPLVTSFP